MTDSNAQRVSRDLGRRLALWGAGSVVAGSFAGVTRGGALQAFGLQNAGWGAIDLAISGVSALQKKPPTSPKLRKVLWFNAALDVGYVATGAYIARSRPRFGGRITEDQAAGHGLAIVVQGAALLILDVTHARALTDHER